MSQFNFTVRDGSDSHFYEGFTLYNPHKHGFDYPIAIVYVEGEISDIWVYSSDYVDGAANLRQYYNDQRIRGYIPNYLLMLCDTLHVYNQDNQVY